MEKFEKMFIKSFLSARYPSGTHELGLDICFDYYNALSYQLLSNTKKLSREILELENELKEKILDYIKANSKYAEGIDMSNYYFMICIVINILKKYYNLDGTRK